MGMYIRQDEQRSRLQERIAADMRAKAAERSKVDVEGPEYDGEKDADIVRNTHSSSALLGVWLVLGAASIGALVFLVVSSA